MGIPSYFSHVIRKYASILRNTKHFLDNNIRFTHLYMDCNSIVYDSYHAMSETYTVDTHDSFEDKLIVDVAKRIDDYIYMIKPTEVVYVAFDGIVPLGKMHQQRKRRYKTQLMASLQGDTNSIPKWNTASITPGTIFMDKLSSYMYSYFNHKERRYNVANIIVSCSDKSGEGEHKLYSHIRNNDMKHANVSVYGLDADLIMLSILHLKYCNNIYVFREAPEFLKSSITVSVKNNKNIDMLIKNLKEKLNF